MSHPNIILPPVDGEVLVDVDAAFQKDAAQLRREQLDRMDYFDPALLALATVMDRHDFETDADLLGQRIRTFNRQQSSMVYDLLNRDAARRQGIELRMNEDSTHPLPPYRITLALSELVNNFDVDSWQEAIAAHDPAMAAIIEGRLFPTGAEAEYDTHQAQILGSTATYAVVNYLVSTTPTP